MALKLQYSSRVRINKCLSNVERFMMGYFGRFALLIGLSLLFLVSCGRDDCQNQNPYYGNGYNNNYYQPYQNYPPSGGYQYPNYPNQPYYPPTPTQPPIQYPQPGPGGRVCPPGTICACAN